MGGEYNELGADGRTKTFVNHSTLRGCTFQEGVSHTLNQDHCHCRTPQRQGRNLELRSFPPKFTQFLSLRWLFLPTDVVEDVGVVPGVTW